MNIPRLHQPFYCYLILAIATSLCSCNIEKKIQRDIDSLDFNNSIKKLSPSFDTLERKMGGNVMMGASDSSGKAMGIIFSNISENLAKMDLDPEIRKFLAAINMMGD